jgi:hypothetical protein
VKEIRIQDTPYQEDVEDEEVVLGEELESASFCAFCACASDIKALLMAEYPVDCDWDWDWNCAFVDVESALIALTR